MFIIQSIKRIPVENICPVTTNIQQLYPSTNSRRETTALKQIKNYPDYFTHQTATSRLQYNRHKLRHFTKFTQLYVHRGKLLVGSKTIYIEVYLQSYDSYTNNTNNIRTEIRFDKLKSTNTYCHLHAKQHRENNQKRVLRSACHSATVE